jgi:hypothetical protein
MVPNAALADVPAPLRAPTEPTLGARAVVKVRDRLFMTKDSF